jgi:epoxyqueuosine reductase QueG
VSSDPAWQPRPGLAQPDLATLWRTSDVDWQRMVAGTAMTRVALPQMRRNLAVALGNTNPAILAAADADDTDDADARPSAHEPVVRRHLRWARAKMAP